MTDATQVAEEPGKAADVEANRSPADPKPRDKPPRPRSGKGSGKGGKRAGAGRPKGGGVPRGPSRAQQNKALEAALGQLLVMPVIPATMFTPTLEGKAFMQGHFTATAPIAAQQLVELSEQSLELRALLEKMTTGSVTMALVMLGVGYLAPPILWTVGRQGEAMAVEAFATMSPEQLSAAAVAAEREAMIADDGATAQSPQASPGSPEWQAAEAQRAAQAASLTDPQLG